jgi:predicted DNA-binding transcriptional regulator AlpA
VDARFFLTNRESKMTKLLRFRDLQQRGVVKSWPMLQRRVARDGFPRGRMLGPNSRAWTEDEIEKWLASRPVAGPAPRGVAKRRQGRPRKTVSTTESATA